MDNFERWRKSPGAKSYCVVNVEGSAAPWRVEFIIDRESVGGGQYHTAEQADDAGIDFMFSGWGDD